MTRDAATLRCFDKGTLCRTLPFALFMAFIALDETVRMATRHGWLNLSPAALYYLYPVKALSVAALLYLYRGEYQELRPRDLLNATLSAVSCAAGIIVFVLWICLEWNLPLSGPSPGFNPALLPEGPIRVLLTATRVAGAVLVVPVMEELFWRSFLLRYLVDTRFESVPLGHFTWTSFAASTVLFGAEHHLFVAGMAAGAAYNLILYKTRSLAQCVLAHAVTNLALALYVLYTGSWHFW